MRPTAENQSGAPAQSGQELSPIAIVIENLDHQMNATREGVSDLENRLFSVMSPANEPPPICEGPPSLEDESPTEMALKKLNLEIEGIRQWVNQIKDRVRL